MKKELLYFILDDNGQSYDNDAEGNIVTAPSLKPLGNTPDGWQEAAIQYGRNDNYGGGIIRTFTVPLGFVKLGQRIIRQLYYAVKGIEAVANLAIAKYNHFTMRYMLFYSSQLNFSTLSDEENVSSIQTTDGGLNMLIKANENTKYEIAVDTGEVIPVVMDGIILYSVVKATNFAYVIFDESGVQQPDVFTSRYIFLGISVLDTETKYPSLLWAESTSYRGVNSLDYDPNDWLMEAQEKPVTVNIKCDSFKATVVGGTGWRIGLYITGGSAGARQFNIVPSQPQPGTVYDIDVAFNVDVELNPYEKVWMFFDNQGDSEAAEAIFAHDNTINFTYTYRKDPTTVNCLRPLYVFQQLIEKITDGKYQADSSFLSTTARDFVLTCGDAIRGFHAGDSDGYTGPKIKTSLVDFFKSYNTPFDICLTTENNIARIEDKAQAYQNITIVDMGGVADLRISPATDYVFSSVQIGWPVQTYDDVNGRSEFNTTHTYTSPLKRTSNTLDLTAVYRADCYGIEFTRNNLDGKTTTDSDADDDVFIVNITGNGPYVLNRPFSSISGVLGGNTVFNTELSPKTCLIRHGRSIRSVLQYHDDQDLIFTTSEKNQALVRTVNGETITEKGNYNIGALGNRLFLPHIFEFNCATSANIVDLIEINPFGLLSFSWKGITLSGFILGAGQQPGTNAQQTFKLLAGPSNNMGSLIF